MIHRSKSPKTSYIKRSGREDFESNTFEFPVKIEEVSEGFGSSEAWKIKGARELDKSLVQLEIAARAFEEQRGGGS